MAEHQKSKFNLSLEEATSEDAEKLATMYARSFHPTSEYMKKAVPDTAVTRKWWAAVHDYAVKMPNVRLMKVVNKDTNDFVALCRWRLHDHQAAELREEYTETWRHIPFSPDHDSELCDPFVKFQQESRLQYMGNRPHIIVELLLTAHEAKNCGAGSLLIDRLCQEADEQKLECFVETNGPVVKFYEKFGFELKDSIPMPGGYGYTENILIRPAKSTKA